MVMPQRHRAGQPVYQQVYQAGIASSPWQHLDTTITRVEGNNYNCHILTNPLYNFYCTLPQRDRLSALQALRGGATRLDKNAAELSRLMGLSKHWEAKLWEVFPTERAMSEAAVDELLGQEGAFAALAEKWIKDSLAIAAYYAHDPPPTSNQTGKYKQGFAPLGENCFRTKHA